MPRRVKGPDGIIRSFPDDATDSEIATALDGSSTITPATRPDETVWQARRRGFVEGAKGSLPARRPVETGALLGGLLTAPMTGGASLPVAMSAAGLGSAGGAAAGSGVEQILTGRPKTAATVGTEMAVAGGTGAVGEGGGRLVASALGKAGRHLYRSALRPTATAIDKYGDLTQAGLDEMAPLGRSPKIMGRMQTSKAASDAMIRDAASRGAAPIPTSGIMRKLDPLVEKAAAREAAGEGGGELAELAEREMALSTAHPSGQIDLMASMPIKREADVLAGTAQNQLRRGTVPSDMTAQIRDAIRSALKEGQETSVQQATGKDLGAQNARTRQLYGLARALRSAEHRTPPFVDVAKPGTWMTPTVRSMGGIAAHQVGKRAQAPTSAALRAALLAGLRPRPSHEATR